METEARTTANIMEDLLEIVEEGEWVERYNSCPSGCCFKRVHDCTECGADYTEHREHEPGCKKNRLIQEARAFIEVEWELESLREEGS